MNTFSTAEFHCSDHLDEAGKSPLPTSLGYLAGGRGTLTGGYALIILLPSELIIPDSFIKLFP